MNLFLTGLAVLAASPSTDKAPSERHASCTASTQPIAEAGLVEIGGIQQWIVAEGRSCTNPVVLIVHGGPGNPNTPFAHTLYGDWAKDFTIVHWD